MASGRILILGSTSGQPKQVQAADSAYVNVLDTPDSSLMKIGVTNASTVGLGLSTTASHYAIEVVNDPTYRTITLGGGGLSDTTILLGVTADTSYPIFANEGQTGASLDHNPGIRWNGSAWQSKVLGDPLASAPWVDFSTASGATATQYSMVDQIALWPASNNVYDPGSVNGQTSGVRFAVFGNIGETIRVVGAKFYAKYPPASYPRTLRCRLWYAGGGPLASVDVTVNADGIATATFASPYTVPASEYMIQKYVISIWDASAGTKYYTYYVNSWGLDGTLPSQPFFIHSREMQLGQNYWAAGNAAPTSTAGGERYPVQPTITIT